MRRRVVFRPIRGGRRAALAIIAALFVITLFMGTVLVLSLLTEPEPGRSRIAPGLIFPLLWITAFGWNAYCYGWRVPNEVVLEDGEIRWKFLFSTGQAPMTAFDSLSRGLFGLSVRLSGPEHRFELLSVVGTAQFIDELRRANPALPPPPESRLRKIRESGSSRLSRTTVHETVGYRRD